MLLAEAIDLKETLFGSNAIVNYAGEGSGFTTLLSSILPTVYVVAGLILFVYLLAGGFMLIAGGNDPKQADAGKTALTNAIIGFVIIFTSYWIIQIIEIITGIKIL